MARYLTLKSFIAIKKKICKRQSQITLPNDFNQNLLFKILHILLKRVVKRRMHI